MQYHIIFTHSLIMSTSKMAFLWRMTLTTSSQPTAQEAAASSWTASLLRTLDSTPATPAASWAALELWPRFSCRVSSHVSCRRGDKTSNSATISVFPSLSSSTQIRVPTGERLSDRRRRYTVYLLHADHAFTTSQVR